MVLHVTVMAGQRQDRLWRQGEGLFVHIMAPSTEAKVNAHLIKYLGERLHVPKSLIEITKGAESPHKTIWVKIPYADLVSRVKRLDEKPQASLFDGGGSRRDGS